MEEGFVNSVVLCPGLLAFYCSHPKVFIIHIVTVKYFQLLLSCLISWLGDILFLFYKATFSKATFSKFHSSPVLVFFQSLLLLLFFFWFLLFLSGTSSILECLPRNITMETTPLPQIGVELPPLVGTENSWDLRLLLFFPST